MSRRKTVWALGGEEIMRLGGVVLDWHYPDPGDPNHKIRPGRWVEATCEEYEHALRHLGQNSLWSSITDPQGFYGSRIVYTEWGSKDGTTPVAACALLDPNDDSRKCLHAVYEVSS